MIMQHYSTQHPARHTITHIHAGAVHTHTHSCSIHYKDTLSKKETTHTLVGNTTPKPISPPSIFKLSFTNTFNDTHTQHLTLHYEVCQPVFLSLASLSPSIVLSFLSLVLSDCSRLARSLLSSTPSPSPTVRLQSRTAPLRASQPALTSLA